MGNLFREEDLDNFMNVKELTKKVKSEGFASYEHPIFKWRLLTANLRNECPLSSESFLFHAHLGQLTVTYVEESGYNVALILRRFKPEAARYNAMSFFVCKYKNYDEKLNFLSELTFTSANTFVPEANVQQLSFKAEMLGVAVVVELHEEALDVINYVFPLTNITIGKIKDFWNVKEVVYYSHLPVASPRFIVKLPEVGEWKCVVRFWNAKLTQAMDSYALTATVHFLNQNGGPEERFVATFTIFSPKIGGKDYVKKVVFPAEAITREFSVCLAFNNELEEFLDSGNDDLYYKVLIEKLSMA